MNIVFVHFGPQLPKHLRRNLTRVVKLFDGHDVFLISDHDHSNLPSSVRKFHVSERPYFRSAETNLSHPVDFRNNFWFLTLKRFLVFNLFMEEHPDPLIHLESDVVISQDFPFEIFARLATPFAFPLISDLMGIPSVLFLKDKSAADLLCELTMQCVEEDPNTIDMLILKKLLSCSPDLITILPSGPSNKGFYTPETSDNFISMQSDGLSIFGGLFDGAAIGQYLLGDDPRNNRGIRRIYFESGYSSLIARSLSFYLSANRAFLDVVSEFERIPLFSIHVHSKDIRVFDEKGFAKVIALRIRNIGSELRKEFLVAVATRQLILALRRRFKLHRKIRKNG